MADMTISQALRRIKKLKGDLAELKKRAQSGVTYVAGCDPAFKFSECMEKMLLATDELLALEARLSVTNAQTSISFSGKDLTLAEAVRRLQEYKGQIAWLESLPVRDHENTAEETRDYNDEMKLVKTTTQYRCALPKAKQAELVEATKKNFDNLNDIVETTNHRTLLKS